MHTADPKPKAERCKGLPYPHLALPGKQLTDGKAEDRSRLFESLKTAMSRERFHLSGKQACSSIEFLHLVRIPAELTTKVSDRRPFCWLLPTAFGHKQPSGLALDWALQMICSRTDSHGRIAKHGKRTTSTWLSHLRSPLFTPLRSQLRSRLRKFGSLRSCP